MLGGASNRVKQEQPSTLHRLLWRFQQTSSFLDKVETKTNYRMLMRSPQVGLTHRHASTALFEGGVKLSLLPFHFRLSHRSCDAMTTAPG